MKRTPFKKKTYAELIAMQKPQKALRRTPLHVAGKSPTKVLKDAIQAILRRIVIARDGGCFLRHYKNEINPQYRECGSRQTKDGHLILQAEHLHTRSNAASFSDPRLVVCVCERHHIYYKPQHGAEYNKLARKFIGPQRSKLWDFVQNDHSPHKVDLQLELLALQQELKTYETTVH